MATRHPQAMFANLLLKIQPYEGELKRAQSHTLTVRSRLNRSFDLSRFAKIGSHSRGTAIRWYSDLDFIAVLRKNEAKWGGRIVSSSTLLNRVRDDLQDRYTQTAVRRDMQAIVVDFAGGQRSLDIVPAIFSRFLPKHGPVYSIPNGLDDWIETSPDSHNRYIKLANLRAGNKMTRVIQLLKWWKHSRQNPIPITSFHIEMLLAFSGVCSGVKSYTQCLYEAFKLMVERECRGLRDPLGISGVIYAVQTDAQWQEAKIAANHAYTHAGVALAAEQRRDFEEANRQWAIVFNGNI